MAKGATWFKMFLSFAPLINAIPSENVGDGVKAAMNYFKTGAEPADMQDMTAAVYNMLKDSIDQAFIDCEEKSEKARKSIMARWHKNDESDSIQPNTEEKRPDQKRKEKTRPEETRTTTPCPLEGGAGAGGGGLPPEILAYAREAARGADHPAAYERKILERIRREGYKTIEEVLAADQRRQEQAAAEDVYDPEAYPDPEHFWDKFLGKA